MRIYRWGLLLGIAAAAGCGTPSDVPPTGAPASPFTSTGEIKLGRFSRVFDKNTKSTRTVYNVTLSKAWEARRGQAIRDAFTQFVVPATSVADDAPIAEALNAYWQHGFFSLPRRAGIDKTELLAPGQLNDVLVVETESTHAVVFRRDCAVSQRKDFTDSSAVFEALLSVFPPLIVGGQVEQKNTFLTELLKNKGKMPDEEPDPKKVEIPKAVKIKPEALRKAQEESPPPPGGDAPK